MMKSFDIDIVRSLLQTSVDWIPVTEGHAKEGCSIKR